MSKLGKIRIFCEGKSDQRFLRDFIEINYNIRINDDELKGNRYIHNLGGWTNLKNVRTKITEELSDYTSLIFLDADDERVGEKAGFKATRNLVDDLMKQWKWTKYDTYIFPNNKDDGEVEDFFQNIINKDNNGIFDCWDDLEGCILNKNENYLLPAKKTKIYLYHEVLLSDREKCKDANRDFKDKDLWDLNYSTNHYLLNLKNFLDKYLK